jgi:hypothetical protein
MCLGYTSVYALCLPHVQGGHEARRIHLSVRMFEVRDCSALQRQQQHVAAAVAADPSPHMMSFRHMGSTGYGSQHVDSLHGTGHSHHHRQGHGHHGLHGARHGSTSSGSGHRRVGAALAGGMGAAAQATLGAAQATFGGAVKLAGGKLPGTGDSARWVKVLSYRLVTAARICSFKHTCVPFIACAQHMCGQLDS